MADRSNATFLQRLPGSTGARWIAGAVVAIIAAILFRRWPPETKEATPPPVAAPTSSQEGKAIVLFSDGTGNSSAKLFKTNVWRMYEAVDLGPATEGKRKQIAFYDNGVGTSSLRPIAAIAGIFGFGLKRNVLEIYRYACRNYSPAQGQEEGEDPGHGGDHIYGFGFSRGAFTMRLVIALIAQQGLVRSTTEEELERKSEEAYRAFRSDFLPRKWQAPTRWFRARRKRRAARRGIPPYDKSKNFIPVIRFVGVWDTVSAYGGPISEITRAIDNWIYALSMPDYQLNERVRRARHALAIDDERDAFHPLLWEEAGEIPRIEAAERDHREACEKALEARARGDRAGRTELLKRVAVTGAVKRLWRGRMQQVWFTGMHADVGGGYPDESLSYVSFLWMMEEAQAAGLRTIAAITDRFRALANSSGPLHDSRRGPGAYYRYQPRRISAWLREPDPDAIVQLDPLRTKDGAPFGFLESVKIHQSVAERIASGTDRYAPFTLPERIRIVPPQRQGETAQQADNQTPTAPPPEEQPARALVSRSVHELIEDPELARARIAETERVWDLVWYRRLIYFAALATTLVLAVLPWAVRPTQLERLCSDDRCIVTGLITQLKILVPSFLEGWVDGIAEKPLFALVLIALILFLLRTGKRLERHLRQLSLASWDSVLGRNKKPDEAPAVMAQALEQPTPEQPLSGQPSPEPLSTEPKPVGLSRIWRSPRYRRFFRSVKWTVLPSLVAIAFLFLVINVLVAGVTQGYFVIVEPRQTFCRDRDPVPATVTAAPVRFSAKAPCTAIALDVTKDEYYEIRLRTSEEWKDAGYDADLANGADLRFYWDSFFLYRRVIGAPWLKPLVEIRDPHRGGSPGGLTNRLFGAQVNIKALHFCEVARGVWGARFKAPLSGQLSIMLNDAALPFAPRAFYDNNEGEAWGWVYRAPDRPLGCLEP